MEAGWGVNTKFDHMSSDDQGSGMSHWVEGVDGGRLVH
jgi:hypothetical protein